MLCPSGSHASPKNPIGSNYNSSHEVGGNPEIHVEKLINRLTSQDQLGAHSQYQHQSKPALQQSMSKHYSAKNKSGSGNSAAEQAKFIQQFSKMSATQNNASTFSNAQAASFASNEMGSGITVSKSGARVSVVG